MFDQIVERAKQEFPKLQVKFKNESLFMKVLGALLFFNKAFMTSYVTTVGSTVYFPSREYVKNHDKSSSETLMHELIHVYDAQSLKVMFGVFYLFPQLLVLLSLPMLLVSWKLSLLCLLFLLPLPSYTRMLLERRGYLCTLYVIHRSGGDVDKALEFVLTQFSGPAYYFMWVFGMKKSFDMYMVKIKNKEHPYDSPVFDSIDKIYFLSGENGTG